MSCHVEEMNYEVVSPPHAVLLGLFSTEEWRPPQLPRSYHTDEEWRPQPPRGYHIERPLTWG